MDWYAEKRAPREIQNRTESALDDIVQEFLVESNENLDRLESELVKLEANPKSSELLASIFRSIHSIKGACGFLGFNKLQALAHAGESLLSKLRDGMLVLTPEISSALLTTGDAIRQMLAAIATTGQDGEEAYNDLIETLKRLQEADAAGSAAEPGHALAASAGAGNRGETISPAPAAELPPSAASSAPPPPRTRKKKSPPKERIQNASPEPSPQDHPPLPPAPVAAEAQASESALSAAVVPAHETADPAHPLEESRKAVAAVQDSTIPVNVTLLDRLMNLVGELVLARNQIMQYAAQQDDSAFLGTIQQLNLVTSELREAVMKTRMQPISRLFDKVPRVARDVSVACGKQVRIETEGKDTELDRTLLEAINDPLTHLVRNAIDHGVEPPARRAEQGKSLEGVMRLRALHEGGQVTIEVSDDGAGIDAERIRKKAVERGLVTAEQAARMSPAEALNTVPCTRRSATARILLPTSIYPT